MCFLSHEGEHICDLRCSKCEDSYFKTTPRRQNPQPKAGEEKFWLELLQSFISDPPKIPTFNGTPTADERKRQRATEPIAPPDAGEQIPPNFSAPFASAGES